MRKTLPSARLINGLDVWNPEVDIMMDQETKAIAYFEVPELDPLQAAVGAYSVYQNGQLGDFYILNNDTLVIPIRFPVLRSALLG